MATNSTAKIRRIEAGGGCNGPINNGRERSRAATRIIITNEPARQPYFSIFIDTTKPALINLYKILIVRITCTHLGYHWAYK
jgi:hypothetical protein